MFHMQKAGRHKATSLILVYFMNLFAVDSA